MITRLLKRQSDERHLLHVHQPHCPDGDAPVVSYLFAHWPNTDVTTPDREGRQRKLSGTSTVQAARLVAPETEIRS
jgi:hypothetical protein